MMSFLKSLLVAMLIAFPMANAISDTEIERFCRETADNGFCYTILKTDPRIPAAGHFSNVLLITITQSTMQVDDATTHLDSVSRKYNGPNGKRRIGVCRSKYGFARDRFHTAWEHCLKKSYHEVDRLAKLGTDAVTDCENVWSRGGPVQKSPLTSYNTNITKTYGIISLLVKKVLKP